MSAADRIDEKTARKWAWIASGAGLVAFLSSCAAPPPPSPCGGYNCQGGQIYYYQPMRYPVSYPPTVFITQPAPMPIAPPVAAMPSPSYLRPSVVVEQEKMMIPTPSVVVDSPPLTVQAPPVVVKQPQVELIPPRVTVNQPTVTVNPPDVLMVPPTNP